MLLAGTGSASGSARSQAAMVGEPRVPASRSPQMTLPAGMEVKCRGSRSALDAGEGRWMCVGAHDATPTPYWTPVPVNDAPSMN
jgi:hypothetical protein